MPSPSLYEIVIHEAAHAAVASRLQMPVLRIDLTTCSTTIDYPLAPKEVAAQYRKYPRVTTAHVRDSVAVLHAGYMAQHTPLIGTCDADDIAAWRQAWTRLPTTAMPWHQVEAQARVAVRGVLLEREMRPPMEDLITTLLRVRVLTGTRLQALLEPFQPYEVAPRPAPRPTAAPVPQSKTYHFSTPATARPADDRYAPRVSDWRSGIVPGLFGLIA